MNCKYDASSGDSPCSSCRPGFYLNPLTFQCITCQGNYNGTSCLLCDYNLHPTTNIYQYKCSKCADAYGVILGVDSCTACIMPNCLTCVFDPAFNKSMCTKCASGYYQETDGNCTYCGESQCSSCTKASKSYTCTGCNEGYYLNKTNNCALCSLASKGCSVCEPDADSNPICTKCIDQTYFFNKSTNSCVNCSGLIQNCSKCIPDSNGTNALCFTCNDNYFIQSPSQCSKCQSSLCNYCSAWDFGKSCSNCISGYYVSTEKQCDVCSDLLPNCNICSKDNNEIVSCSYCKSGFFLNKTKICVACSSFCKDCTDIDHCYSCSDGYYSQINKTGQYCMSPLCDPPFSIGNETSKTCQLCSDLYENCSECSSTSNCTKCQSNSSLMLPYMSSCSPCNDDLHILSNETYCAYKPKVADPITRSRSEKTGKSVFTVDCSVNQSMNIYGVCFIHYDSYLNLITFSDIKNRFDANYTLYFELISINRTQTDNYWTTYFAISSNHQGKANFLLPEFMNADMDYRMYVWCHNNGTTQNPLNIVSDVAYLDWIQEDNKGKTIKFAFYIDNSLSNANRAFLADVLSNLLGLSKFNRQVIYNVIPDSETVRMKRILASAFYEYFYIERDYTIIPIDNSNTALLLKIDGQNFLKDLNAKITSLGFNIQTFSYLELNSTFQMEVPKLKSIDFPKILIVNNSSAAVNISVINTNAMVYVGIVNDVAINDVAWEWFLQGKANENKAFIDFQKVYLLVGEVLQWSKNDLDIGSSYAVFIGATNEDEYMSAMKTNVYRVIFKTKTQKVSQ